MAKLGKYIKETNPPKDLSKERSLNGKSSPSPPKGVILSLVWWGTHRKTGSVVQLTGELTCLHISILVLSEVFWPGTSSTVVGGYTIYWSGRPDGQHTGGVAIAVAGQYSIQHRD